jgi:O-antigen/teichoic acid export membrane protein
VAVAALSPLLGALLHLDVPVLLLLGLMSVPMAVVYAAQGVLQGLERFVRLAAVLAAGGVAKFGAAAVTALVGGGVLLVVALLAAGWVLVAALALGLVPPATRHVRGARVAHLPRLVAGAVVPTSGLLFLSSMDVLLARHHLSGPESGAYTVGALFEKAAFWGLGFLATLHYPAMAQPLRRRAALVAALGTTAGVGLLGVAGTAGLGRPLVTIVGGESYAHLGPIVWRFTALGVCLALVQVLAYAGLARAATRMGVAMWLAGAAAVVLTGVSHADVTGVVDVMLGCTALLVVVGLVIERRSFDSPGSAPPGAPETARHDPVLP